MQITKSLNVVDLASLAFVNKRFSQIIGSSPWKHIRDTPDYRDRTDFVVRLAKDLNDWVICITCGMLHPSTLIPSWLGAVEGDEFDTVGAPSLFECLRIYEKHVRWGLERGFLGKPVGCCLDVLREVYPPSPSSSLTRFQAKALEGVDMMVIVTAQHEPLYEFNPRRPFMPNDRLGWNAKFEFTFSKSKNETLDLVDLIQTNGFRICHHLTWGNNDNKHDPKLPDVNNFAWGRFQLPRCPGELPYITCPYCETCLDIRFHHQQLVSSVYDHRFHELDRAGTMVGFSISIMKTWTLRKTGTKSMGKVYQGKEAFCVKPKESGSESRHNAPRLTGCCCM